VRAYVESSSLIPYRRLKKSGAVERLPRDENTVLFFSGGYSRITMKEMFNKFEEANQRQWAGIFGSDKMQEYIAKRPHKRPFLMRTTG